MKRIIISVFWLNIAVFACTASAQDSPIGLQIGASAMTTHLDRDDKLVDNSEIGFKLFMQYRFNSWLGLEGSLYNSGELSSNATSAGNNDVELVYKGYTMQGIGYIPLPIEQLEFFLKAGYYQFDVDLTIDGASNGNGDDSGAMIGTGLSLKITDQFHFRTEFDWYDASDASLWSAGLGAEYHF